MMSCSSSPFQPGFAADAPLAVLVADDVAEVRDIIALALRAEGCRVWHAASGKEAVGALQRQHFDVLITDVLMPDGDGLEVIRHVRRTAAATRILAISGGGRYMSGGDCLRVARGLGADGVLMKPFSRTELLAAIEELGGRRTTLAPSA